MHTTWKQNTLYNAVVVAAATSTTPTNFFSAFWDRYIIVEIMVPSKLLNNIVAILVKVLEGKTLIPVKMEREMAVSPWSKVYPGVLWLIS